VHAAGVVEQPAARGGALGVVGLEDHRLDRVVDRKQDRRGAVEPPRRRAGTGRFDRRSAARKRLQFYFPETPC